MASECFDAKAFPALEERTHDMNISPNLGRRIRKSSSSQGKNIRRSTGLENKRRSLDGGMKLVDGCALEVLPKTRQ